MERKYQFRLWIKISGLVMLFGSWDGYFEKINQSGATVILVIPLCILTYAVINSWCHVIIVNEKGITVKTLFGIAWPKSIQWQDAERLTKTAYGSGTFYVLEQKYGRSMYLAVIKNLPQLLSDIYYFAPHIKMDAAVKQKINKAREKGGNLLPKL